MRGREHEVIVVVIRSKEPLFLFYLRSVLHQYMKRRLINSDELRLPRFRHFDFQTFLRLRYRLRNLLQTPVRESMSGHLTASSSPRRQPEAAANTLIA